MTEFMSQNSFKTRKIFFCKKRLSSSKRKDVARIYFKLINQIILNAYYIRFSMNEKGNFFDYRIS